MNILDPIFYRTLFYDFPPVISPSNHVGTYFQCYGRSNKFINFTPNELNWFFFYLTWFLKFQQWTPPPPLRVSKIIQQQMGIKSHWPFDGRLTQVNANLVAIMAYTSIANVDAYNLYMGDEKVSNNSIDKIC
jgi:hypothetical protein